MWDDNKRKRFNELREPGRQLDPAEQAEIEAMIKEIEESEAAFLKPATERLRQENDRRERQNRQLAHLVQRKEILVERLEGILAAAQAEELAIKAELASVAASDQDFEAED